MKLNQNPSIRQSNHNSEFEQFKARILKQADSFGVSVGATNSVSTHSFNPEVQQYLLDRSAEIRSTYFSNSLKGVSYKVAKAIRKWVRSNWSKYQARAQIKRLLGLTDHYLDDIGFHRADLEAALISLVDINLIRHSPLDNLDRYKLSVFQTENTADEIEGCCDDSWAKAA